MSDEHRTDPGSDSNQHLRTEAEVRHGWWPGWIWAVPLAVVLILGWLGLRELTSGGEDIQIAFDKAYGMKVQDTDVVYRGVQVGTVTKVALSPKGDGVVVTAAIKDGATQYLRAGTRFWLRGANPSLGNLSSLGALLSGPTIVMEPGKGKSVTHFTGLAYQPALPAMQGKPLHYAVSFTAAVGGLERGDPVVLRGFTVGEVTAVGFRYDATSGALSTPVTLALYPSRFHIAHAKDPQSVATLHNAMVRLIHDGLRASLERDPPLIGSYRVSLKMVPGVSPPQTETTIDGLPQIPVAPGGGLDAILHKFNAVPIDQIASNVLDVTHRVDKLVASPQLHDAIVQLDATLTGLHKTVTRAGPKLTRLIDSLRRTASELDRTARTMHQTIGGPTAQNGLDSTLRQISQAARSIRELADYLDRHPDALIKGRSGG